MRWTLRLKRHGGAAGLALKRAAQIERLNRLRRVSTDTFITDCLTWMSWNSLRVLGVEVEGILDEMEPSTDIV